MPADLQALEAAIGYAFANRSLLVRALTHRSLASEQRAAGISAADNEQFEFLGDAVLGFVVSEWLLQQFPQEAEGKLSVFKATLVSAVHLREVAARLGLGEFLHLSHGLEKEGGRGRSRVLANSVEALIAAVYLDGGLEAARALILSEIVRDFDPAEADAVKETNYKGPLNERAIKLGLPAPRYSIVSSAGPDHAKMFTAEVRVGKQLVTRGEGSTKKAAGQKAARAMLNQLDGACGDAGG